MKAVVIQDFVTDFDQIRVSSIPSPTAERDRFLIQVKAAGVNFVDTLYARGKHQNNRSLVRPPFTLGLEFAGEILSAPKDSGYRRGDRVFGGYTGSYSEIISLASTSSLRRIPTSWDYRGAAGIGATLPVSYGALVLRAGLKRGETVLIHAAAGGLGIMAVQVATAVGCRVIGTAGSAEKCALVKRHGAEVCLDYSLDPKWWDHVQAITNGKGVDVVFDPVGLIDLSLKCIAHRGRLLVVGFAGREGNMEKIAMNRVLLKQVSLIGYRYGESLRRIPAEEEEIWNGLQPLIDTDKIKPVVYDCEYKGLESVPRALKDMMDRKVWGKATITLDQPSINQSRSRL